MILRISGGYSKKVDSFPSFVAKSGFKTYGLKWGASPAKGGKYVNMIGNEKLRNIIQNLRKMRVPLKNWRFADPGHIHFWRR